MKLKDVSKVGVRFYKKRKNKENWWIDLYKSNLTKKLIGFKFKFPDQVFRNHSDKGFFTSSFAFENGYNSVDDINFMRTFIDLCIIPNLLYHEYLIIKEVELVCTPFPNFYEKLKIIMEKSINYSIKLCKKGGFKHLVILKSGLVNRTNNFDYYVDNEITKYFEKYIISLGWRFDMNNNVFIYDV